MAATLNVLHVEDQASITDAVSFFLKRAFVGLEVVIATTANNGWGEFIQDPSRFGLVILDENLSRGVEDPRFSHNTFPNASGSTLARVIANKREELGLKLKILRMCIELPSDFLTFDGFIEKNDEVMTVLIEKIKALFPELQAT